MHLQRKTNYFLLTATKFPDSTKSIFIETDFSTLLDKWGANAKVAACFRVNGEGVRIDDFCFRGKIYFFLIGPTPLNKIPHDCLQNTYVWLTYGMYNVIVATSSESQKQKIIATLSGFKLRYELWEIEDSVIVDDGYKNIPEVVDKQSVSSRLLEYYKKDKLMFPVIREYYAQIYIACERSRYLLKDLYDRMIAFHTNVENIVFAKIANLEDKSFPFNYLTSINACLTRYNSQVFSGFTPVRELESHTWSHSLLGIGMATVAINHFGDFFCAKLKDTQLFNRFLALLKQEYTEDCPILKIEANNDFWTKNLLYNLTEDIPKSDSITLLTYFSSRDGFRNQYNTLSIPLISLYGCNTLGWSLKTLSHEGSHVIVDSILNYLLGDVIDDQWLDKFYQKTFYDDSDELKTFYDAILNFFGSGLMILDSSQMDEQDYSQRIALKVAFEHFKEEMKEIMTHAFDFLYFYNSNIESYIEEIWMTWIKLPCISTSIQEYVIRSLCVIVLNELDQPDTEQKAIKTLKRILERKNKKLKNEHIDMAIRYLCNESLGRVILDRKFLVKFVKGFLFSEEIRSYIAIEKWELSSSAKEEKKKEFSSLKIPDSPFNNPLNVADFFACNKTLSDVKSFLMYYNLAFNYEK